MTVFNCSLRLTRKQILRPLHLDEVHSNRRSAHVFMLKLHVHVVDEDQVPSYSPHSIVNTHLCCRLLAYILFLCVLVSCHSILLINATITLWLVVFFNPLPKPLFPAVLRPPHSDHLHLAWELPLSNARWLGEASTYFMSFAMFYLVFAVMV